VFSVDHSLVTHQQKIIDEGILANLLKLMSNGKYQLQLKALAVLQHFDGKFHMH
jgi:hypothetical protein